MDKTKNEKMVKLQDGEWLPPLIPEESPINMITFAAWHRNSMMAIAYKLVQQDETENYYECVETF